MAELEREKIVETEGRLPDGREVKRVVETERVVAAATEARGGTTGTGLSMVLLVSVAICVLAMAGVWFYFFA